MDGLNQMEASAIDGAVEWQGLGASIFDDVPLVDAGCTSFILQIGGGTSVTVEPRREAFDRTEVLSDDKLIGTGADACRMTGALLWDSAVVLASYVARNRKALCGSSNHSMRAIELGAGLGLAGLAAAAALNAETVLTDRSECLPLLNQSIALNGLAALVSAADLDWGDQAAARALGRFHLVLLSDCIYEVEACEPLAQTLAALLADSGGQALLTYDEAIGRPAAAASFRECAARCGLVWEELQQEQEDAASEEEALEAFTKGSVKLARLRLRSRDEG